MSSEAFVNHYATVSAAMWKIGLGCFFHHVITTFLTCLFLCALIHARTTITSLHFIEGSVSEQVGIKDGTRQQAT